MEETRSDDGSREGAGEARGGRWAVVVGCVGAVALAAAPLIVMGVMTGRHGLDQELFHEPTVRIFAHDWPRFDFVGYLAASTPLYHLVLAAVCRFVSESDAALQAAGLAKSLALAGVLAWACCDGGRRGMAVAATMAVMSSHYVFCAAAWLAPDNFGWLWVLVVMLLCLRQRGGWGVLVMAGVAVSVLVMTRQSHLWAAAMVWAAAWMGWGRDGGEGTVDVAAAWRREARARVWRTAGAVALTAKSFVIVGVFAQMWGGLTPPLFHGENQGARTAGAEGAVGMAWAVVEGLNPATGVFVLAAFGLYGVAFVPALAPAGVELWRRWGWWAAAGLAAVALASMVPATTFDAGSGRSRGVWNAARVTPDLWGHVNPAMVGLAVMGAAVVAAACRRLGRRDAVVLLVGLAAFTAAQAASSQLRTRYVAPLVLIVLALAVCREARGGVGEIGGRVGAWVRRLEVVGPAALAVVFAVGTFKRAVYDPPTRPWTQEMLIEALFPDGGGPERIRRRGEEGRVEWRGGGGEG